MTLNQIVKELTKIGNDHEQINYVYFGDVWERISNGEVTYPAMFMTLTGASFGAKDIGYSFSLYFMDRMLMEETNETEVLSDMTQVAGDIVAQLRYPEDYSIVTWTLNQNLPITFYTESDPDLLAGVKLDINLTVPFINNRCQIPTQYTY
ncbi:MAG TPA: hypothetical protein DEB23_02595 [Chitinophagaceae bacterium]|nr:hypothetical protein [Chitinophagaceae bacterium]